MKKTLRTKYHGFKLTIIDTDDSYWVAFSNGIISDNTERFNDSDSAIDAAKQMIDFRNQQNIHCVVACHNAMGIPDLYPIIINVNQIKIYIGEHYRIAKQYVENQGYDIENVVVFDNDDTKIRKLFDWKKVKTITDKNIE